MTEKEICLILIDTFHFDDGKVPVGVAPGDQEAFEKW